MSDEENKPRSSAATITLMQDASVLRERFDTQPTIQRLERALRGCVTHRFINKTSGEIETQKEVFSKPVCSDEGFERMVAQFGMILNAQGLTSYFKREEQYNRYISDVWKSFAEIVMENRIKWGIDITDYDYVMDSIMYCIRLELTQAIEGKAMDSITKTSRLVENMSPQKSGFSPMNLFGGRK